MGTMMETRDMSANWQQKLSAYIVMHTPNISLHLEWQSYVQ